MVRLFGESGIRALQVVNEIGGCFETFVGAASSSEMASHFGRLTRLRSKPTFLTSPYAFHPDCMHKCLFQQNWDLLRLQSFNRLHRIKDGRQSIVCVNLGSNLPKNVMSSQEAQHSRCSGLAQAENYRLSLHSFEGSTLHFSPISLTCKPYIL